MRLRLDDMGWAEARTAANKRIAMKRNLRIFFFQKLLREAQDYASEREAVLEAGHGGFACASRGRRGATWRSPTPKRRRR